MGQIEEAYRRAVIRGQEAGDIPADRDARMLAKYLVNCENGIFVSAKSGMSQESLKDVAKVTLSALE